MHSKRSSVLYKIMRSYMFILLVPIIIGSIIYIKAVNIIETDEKSYNKTLLTHNRDIVDNQLQDIESISTQIALDNEISALCDINPIEVDKSKVINIIDCTSKMPNYKLTNKLIYDYFIFFKRSNMIISSTETFITKSLFYNDFQYSGQNFNMIEDYLKDTGYINKYLPAASVKYRNNNLRLITYIRSFPLNSYTRSGGVITVFIYEDNIKKLFKNINVGDSGFFYIFDESGDIITGFSGSQLKYNPNKLNIKNFQDGFIENLSGEKMIISVEKSNYNDWQYVSAVPVRFVLQKVDYIRKITLLSVLGIFLIGIGIAYLFSYYNMKPIKAISDIVKGFTGKDNDISNNEYDYLNSSITQIIKNTKNLSDELSKQLPILQNSFFQRLIDGNFLSQDEIKNNADNYKIDVSGLSIGVLVINIEGYECSINQENLKELDIIRYAISDKINDYKKDKAYICYNNNTSMAILLIFNLDIESECIEHINQLVDNLYQNIENKYGIKLTFGIGKVYHSLIDISNSYKEARQALQYKVCCSNRHLLFFDDLILNNKCLLYYPVEAQTKLIRYVVNCNEKEAIKLLSELYEENCVRRKLSLNNALILMDEIKGTIIQQAVDVIEFDHLKNIMESIENSVTLDDFFKKANEIEILICREYSYKKNENKEQLKLQILEFLNKSYMNENITIGMVAERFQMSEDSMYKFFKDYFNLTFADYLESIRMNYACKLLNNKSIDINSISQMVGYSCSHTFRRAFKRIYKVTPTYYRGILNV